MLSQRCSLTAQGHNQQDQPNSVNVAARLHALLRGGLHPGLPQASLGLVEAPELYDPPILSDNP